ncbi:MAG: hypothetical protein AAF654_06475 [Myxococcota bacterium]
MLDARLNATEDAAADETPWAIAHPGNVLGLDAAELQAVVESLSERQPT